MTAVELYEGDRRHLLPLFALADDSPSQIASYIGSGEVMVARKAASIVGHAQLVATDDAATLELKSLAVETAWRRRGLGAALLTAVVSRSRARGASRLLVATATADLDNLRFYQRRGFRMLRIVRDAFNTASGYAEAILVDAIPLRDQLWLDFDLQATQDASETTPRSHGDGRGGAPGPMDRWETRHNLRPDEIDRLEDEIYAFNAERTGYRDAQGLGFLIRRGDDLVAAVAGYTWGGVCELRQVWVREDARGQGLGRGLLQAAISEASQRGCGHVFVSTYDFQAPGFYRRLGFDLVAEAADKPIGHVEFIFRRSLGSA